MPLSVSLALADFVGAMTQVARIASTRTVMPILGHVKVSARDGAIILHATDLELFATITVPSETSGAGELLMPARTVLDAVRTLNATSGEVRLTEGSDGRASLTCGRIKFALNTMPVESFNSMPSVTNDGALSFNTDALKTMLRRVRYAVAEQSDGHMVLAGVYLKWDGMTLTAAATDTHRLAEATTMELVSGEAEPFEVVIPQRLVTEVLRLTGETIALVVSDSHVQFSDGNTALGGRLIVGQYPAYERVVPREALVRWTANVGEFRDAILRADIAAKQDAHRVVVRETSTGSLEIMATSAEVGEVRDEIDITYLLDEGIERVVAAYNAQYVTQAVDAAGAEMVTFYSNGPQSAAMLKFDGVSEYTCVIMPMLVVA